MILLRFIICKGLRIKCSTCSSSLASVIRRGEIQIIEQTASRILSSQYLLIEPKIKNFEKKVIVMKAFLKKKSIIFLKY
jgi:hypothetical protein